MNDDWILSTADIIELLGCSRDDILDFLQRGELHAASASPLGIAHEELSRFIAAHRAEALQRGTTPRIDPLLELSRPRFDRDVVDGPDGN